MAYVQLKVGLCFVADAHNAVILPIHPLVDGSQRLDRAAAVVGAVLGGHQARGAAAQHLGYGGIELAGGVVGVHHVIAAAAQEPREPPCACGVIGGCAGAQAVHGNAGGFHLALKRCVVPVKQGQLHFAAQPPQLRQQVHHQVLGPARLHRRDHMQYPHFLNINLWEPITLSVVEVAQMHQPSQWHHCIPHGWQMWHSAELLAAQAEAPVVDGCF